MKSKNLIASLSVATLLLLTTASHAEKFKNKRVANNNISISAEVTEQLSSEEVDKLLFMREEEKLARDVYLTLHEKWKNPVFIRISRSEQAHMDAMALLLSEFQLDDPVVDDTIGVFTDPELAQMYQDLVEKGQQSMLDALYVGGLIEEVDIEDIQHGIDETDNPLIISVYENLLKGSRNHLRAFVGQIESRGMEYEPQVLEEAAVFEIVDSPVERG